jgi:hypothetical protein
VFFREQNFKSNVSDSHSMFTEQVVCSGNAVVVFVLFFVAVRGYL